MELVVTENITLNGVIDAAEGWFQPAGSNETSDTSDIEDAVREQMQAQDALLLGRVTFESFRGYWPLQTDDTIGITAHLNAVSKYVISDTLDEPGWENTTLLRRPLEDNVRKLKTLPGKELGVTGSISVVRSLTAAGLVDTHRLFVYPRPRGTTLRKRTEANEPTTHRSQALSIRSRTHELPHDGGLMVDDVAQIRALIENWAKAVHAGDMDIVLADHADDIVMFDVPPPNEGVRGIDAYRETWPPFFEWQRRGAIFEITSLDITAATRSRSRMPCFAAEPKPNSPKIPLPGFASLSV